MPIVEVQGLTKKFGERTAVDNLSLEISEGEVLAFLGPNGAGKTTTIRMLAGIISPSAGHALIAGQPIDREVENLHEIIGLLTETPGFYDSLNARRNLEYFAGFYDGLDVANQVEKYLRIMELWDRREDKVGTFSKGMKQRLALARALLHEPKVLFLDEPTSGLDPESARDVRELIKKLSTEGRTIFLSTHNLPEAEELCHRIAVVQTRLLAMDTPANLRQRLFRTQIIISLESVSDAMLRRVTGLPFVRRASRDGNRLLVELNDTRQNRPELVKQVVEAGGRIEGVSEEQHSLEEVYLNLVKDANEKNGD